MKAISVSTFAIAAVAMMFVVPVTALPTAISLATNASPTLPVIDGTVPFGPPTHASQTDLPTPTPTGVVRLDIHGNADINHSWNSSPKKEKLPDKQQKEAEPKVESKKPAQKKTEEANNIFGPENPLNHLYFAPYSCCRCCRSNSVPSTFDEQVRQDMEKSKAEDAAKKQKQMEPTPNMNVSKPPESTPE
ncbi:hypothetical protein EV368DRAFT_86518 [Lentinula lateritia]|nr:hypothetical protein EV368DRAFT_86518 [Lentinula lateritia]